MTLHIPDPDPAGDLSLSELAKRCEQEINLYRQGEACDDLHCVELLNRALTQRDPLAWEVMQNCLHETVLRWMRGHPQRNVACRLDSEENYVALAFERFWVATVKKREVELQTVASALRYLGMCLNSAVVDTLRLYIRPHEVPLPEPDSGEEPFVQDHTEHNEVWDVIQRLLPEARGQRIAYLLYQAGLKPRQIVQLCSEEFSDVREIYRVQRKIVEHFMRRADSLRWQLGD